MDFQKQAVVWLTYQLRDGELTESDLKAQIASGEITREVAWRALNRAQRFE